MLAPGTKWVKASSRSLCGTIRMLLEWHHCASGGATAPGGAGLGWRRGVATRPGAAIERQMSSVGLEIIRRRPADLAGACLSTDVALHILQGLRFNQQTLSFVAATTPAEANHDGISCAFGLDPTGGQRVPCAQKFEIVEIDAP